MQVPKRRRLPRSGRCALCLRRHASQRTWLRCRASTEISCMAAQRCGTRRQIQSAKFRAAVVIEDLVLLRVRACTQAARSQHSALKKHAVQKCTRKRGTGAQSLTRCILTYGLGPKHVSHTIGKSLRSQPSASGSLSSRCAMAHSYPWAPRLPLQGCSSCFSHRLGFPFSHTNNHAPDSSVIRKYVGHISPGSVGHAIQTTAAVLKAAESDLNTPQLFGDRLICCSLPQSLAVCCSAARASADYGK